MKPEWRQLTFFDVFIVNIAQIVNIVGLEYLPTGKTIVKLKVFFGVVNKASGVILPLHNPCFL